MAHWPVVGLLLLPLWCTLVQLKKMLDGNKPDGAADTIDPTNEWKATYIYEHIFAIGQGPLLATSGDEP